MENQVTDIKEDIKQAVKETKNEEIKATQNTTVVKLPSNGLINPSIKSVTLRRMTTKEVKTLHTSKDPNYLTVLLLNCIVEPSNIKDTDLHPNDIIYLLFVLRKISSPRNIEQQVRCPECGKLFTSKVIVDNLTVNYYEGQKENEFTTTLPDSGDKLTFKILSEGELINSEKIANRQIKTNELDEEAAEWHRLISRMACQLLTKNEMEFDEFKNKVEYLESLSAYDFESFQQAYSDIVTKFGVKETYISQCTNCKEDVEVMAYIAPDFFRLV